MILEKEINMNDVMLLLDNSTTIDLSNSTVLEFDYNELKNKMMQINVNTKDLNIIAKNTLFKCDLKIENTEIGELSLNGATIEGNVDFSKTVFEGLVTCSKAQFMKTFSCSQATFYLKAVFSSANFYGDVSFEKCKFVDTVSFMNAQFITSPCFFRTQFTGLSFFKHLKIKQENSVLDFTDVKFEETSRFADVDCTELRFDRCLNSAMLDLDQMDEMDQQKIKYISFQDVINLGFIHISWDKADVYNLIMNNPDPRYTYKSKAE